MKKLIADFGADPSGQTDSTQAIQAALNHGGYISVDPGTFLTGPLHATRPVQLVGECWDCIFLASASMQPNDSVIRVSPDMQYGARGYLFENFRIMPQGGSGVATGIRFATLNQGQYLSMPRIRGVGIWPMGTHAVVSVNNNSDGLAALQITESILVGGITLNNVGDSLQIDKNIISGTGIGVFASFVSGAVAPAITRNNITNKDGAVYLIGAGQADISRNNIEHIVYGYTGTVDASVYLQGSRMCDVRQNAINGGDECGTVRLVNCTRTAVTRNTLITQQPHKHIHTQNGSGNTNTDNQYIDSLTRSEVSGFF